MTWVIALLLLVLVLASPDARELLAAMVGFVWNLSLAVGMVGAVALAALVVFG